MYEIDNKGMLAVLLIIITVCCSGGAIAGIISLIFIRRDNAFIKIVRLLIGAIGGYEAIVLHNIILLEDSRKNVNEILKIIIYFHKDLTLTQFFIPGMLGAIGAYTAIFIIRRIVRSRR